MNDAIIILAQALLLCWCSVFVAGLACEMVKNREREQTVNKLNTLAKKCGLDGVSKQASKKFVLALG